MSNNRSRIRNGLRATQARRGLGMAHWELEDLEDGEADDDADGGFMDWLATGDERKHQWL